MKTTIALEKSTVDKLERLKIYPREPICDVVDRLVKGVPDESVSSIDEMRLNLEKRARANSLDAGRKLWEASKSKLSKG
jgi:hypothetical protein